MPQLSQTSASKTCWSEDSSTCCSRLSSERWSPRRRPPACTSLTDRALTQLSARPTADLALKAAETQERLEACRFIDCRRWLAMLALREELLPDVEPLRLFRLVLILASMLAMPLVMDDRRDGLPGRP